MGLRALLPWRRFAIETSWPPSVAAIEIRKRLADSRWNSSDLPFVGQAVSETVFRFSRAISYRNSFLPVIEARVEPSHRGGARIRVRMGLNGFVIAFMALWLLSATFGAIVALAGGRPGALSVVGFPLFGVTLVTLPFALEARKSEAAVRSIFAAAPAGPPSFDSGEPYR
jgi:hypothetical protein